MPQLIQYPACPGCAKPMMLCDETAGHSQRRSFHCSECGTIFSEMPSLGALSPDRALTLNFEAGSRVQ